MDNRINAIEITLASLALSLIALTPAKLTAEESQTFTAGEVSYAVIEQIEADSFKARLSLCPVDKQPSQPLRVLFGAKDANNYYRLDLSKESAVLHRIEKGVSVELGRSVVAAGHGKARYLLIKRNSSLLSVVLNGKVLVERIDSTFSAGPIGVDKPNVPAVTNYLSQPTAPLYETDNFMRTAEQQELAPFEKVQGEWRFHSVAEEVFKFRSIDPYLNAALKSSAPDPTRSPNPFSLEGKAKDWAMVTRGHWFWDDYRYEASVNSQGGAFGLVFNLVDKDDYFMLRWSAVSHRSQPRSVELLRVKGKSRERLARAFVPSKINQWYHLSVATLGTRIQASLDGDTLFTINHDECLGGKVGLFLEGKESTSFDDVLVASTLRYPFEDIELAAPYAERKIFGDPKWKNYLLQLSFNTPESGLLNIIVADRGPDGSLIFRADATGRIVLLESTYGQERVLEESLNELMAGETYELEFDLTTEGLAKVYLDGTLKLRSRIAKQSASGCWGFSAKRIRRTVRLSSIAVAFEKNEDLERTPENAIYVDDPYMGHWSSPAGPWVPTDSTYTKFWHTSDFFGRYVVSFPLRHGTDLLFATRERSAEDTNPDPLAGYVVRVIPADAAEPPLWPLPKPKEAAAPATTATTTTTATAAQAAAPDPFKPLTAITEAPERYRVQLWRLGRKVAEVETEAPDADYLKEEVAEMISPRKLAPAPAPQPKTEHHPIVVHKNGHYISIEIRGSEVISFRDPEPLNGRRMALKTPWKMRQVDFFRVNIVRSQVFDELFERAPADWERVGDWRILNRFSCDPRWSHMTAITKGTAILWHKNEFPGDFTFEFFIGNRMRPADIRQWPYYYPRTGDLNAVFCGDGKNLDSGYLLTLGSWDVRWTEEKSMLYRRDKVVTQSDVQYIPRHRRKMPWARIIAIPWISTGRAIHGAWYYVKIRRKAGNIDVYFDHKKVFSYRDDKPLDGTRLGIWTQNNHIVTARVRVSYEKTRTPKRTVTVDPESLEETLEVENQFVKKESFEPGTEVSSETHPSFVNDFESGCQWKNLDEEQGAFLETIASPVNGGGRALKLSNLNPGGSFGALVPIKGSDLRSFNRLTFDYRLSPTAFVNFYIRLEGDPRIFFIEFSGNDAEVGRFTPLGKIDGVRKDGQWARAEFDLAAALGKLGAKIGRLAIEEFKIGSYHEGYVNAGLTANHQGAEVSIDNFALIAAGGTKASIAWKYPKDRKPTAVAWTIDRKPITTPSQQVNSSQTEATFNSLSEGLWYFHLAGGNLSGHWSKPVHFPVYVTSEGVKLKVVSPRPNSNWGGDTIRMSLVPKTKAHPVAALSEFMINGVPVELNPNIWTYQTKDQTLTLNVESTGLSFQNGAEVNFKIRLGRPNSSPIEGSWRYTVAYRLDTTPPRAPAVQNYLVDADFDNDLEGWKEAIQNENHRPLLIHDRTDGSTGPGCAKIVNLGLGGYAGSTILTETFNLAQHRLVSFDYKIVEDVQTDLVVNVSGKDKRVSFRDLSSSLPALGSFPKPLVDGKWHYTETNLAPMLKKQGFHPLLYVSTKLQLTDTTYQSNAPGVGYSIDNFRVAPIISTASPYRITWATSDFSGIKGYSYSWLWKSKPYYVTKWHALEPFFNPGDKKFETLFIDETNPRIDISRAIRGEDGLARRWHPITAKPGGTITVPKVDLLSLWPGKDMVSYAVAIVHSEAEGAPAYFHVGHDDGMRAWLNGELVYDRHDHIPCVADQFSFPVRLRKGPNQVLVKLDQGYGEWEFTFKVNQALGKAPEKKIMTRKPEAEFTGLPESDGIFVVQAVDHAGNWSEQGAYRFFVDNTIPQWGTPSPASGAKAASTKSTIPITDNYAGVNVQGLTLELDGRTYQPTHNSTTFVPSTGSLTWDWMLGRPKEQEFVENGHQFTLKVSALLDHAGNLSKPFEWSWSMDYSKDKKLPVVPDVITSTRKHLFNNNFSAGGEQWAMRNPSYGGRPERWLRSEVGDDYCLRVYHPISGGSFDTTIWKKAYNAAEYPFVEFDYRIKSNVHLYMMARVGSQFYAVRFVGQGCKYPLLGNVTLARDDKWHHLRINLYELLKKKLPAAKTITISELIMGNYGYAKSGGYWTYYVDNFAIHGESPTQPELKVKSLDITGIKAFSYSVDQAEASAAPKTANVGRDGLIKLAKPLAPGLHYIHISSQDNNNNWSPTLHYPYQAGGTVGVKK